MERTLSLWSLPHLRKADLVRHSGMLCIVLGFLRNRLGIRLRAPDDSIITVSRDTLKEKAALRTQALLSVRASCRGLKEYPGYLVGTADALTQFIARAPKRPRRRKLSRR